MCGLHGLCHFEFRHGACDRPLELDEGRIRGVDFPRVFNPLQGRSQDVGKGWGIRSRRHIWAANTYCSRAAYSVRCTVTQPGYQRCRLFFKVRQPNFTNLWPAEIYGILRLVRRGLGLHNTRATPFKRWASLGITVTPELMHGNGIGFPSGQCILVSSARGARIVTHRLNETARSKWIGARCGVLWSFESGGNGSCGPHR